MNNEAQTSKGGCLVDRLVRREAVELGLVRLAAFFYSVGAGRKQRKGRALGQCIKDKTFFTAATKAEAKKEQGDHSLRIWDPSLTLV